MCENEARKGEGHAVGMDRWVRVFPCRTGIGVYPTVILLFYLLENRKSPDMYLGASGGVPVSRRI